jgi:hypothetical protein
MAFTMQYFCASLSFKPCNCFAPQPKLAHNYCVIRGEPHFLFAPFVKMTQPPLVFAAA